MPPKQFDVQDFNKKFNEDKAKRKEESKQRELDKLAELNKPVREKRLLEMNFADILIGIKDSWFGILDDLLQQKYTFDTFTKHNRLFFVGLTLILIGLIVFVYNFLVDDPEEEKLQKDKNTIEKHYIYQMVPNGDKNDVTKDVNVEPLENSQ